jgi:exonuclease SbcC
MMRPLRLLLDGFGCYRERTEADFSDVDFFALVGPTGAGKSTVIDGLCFALYGTVPRWGKENVIAQALAPAANSCRVCLVFETAGKRYGAVRALSRDARGRVHTREARLELLDGGVPANAPIDDILAASVRQLAEGPDEVKAQVEKILGLTYDHFTQSVLLPQGRFSDFLHAKAAERQGLLVELLAFGVYGEVGQRARESARLAAERGRLAQDERDRVPDATEEAERRAAARVSELRELGDDVQRRLAALRKLGEDASQATSLASQARAELALLAGIRVPEDVPALARKIDEASQQVAESKSRRDAADQAERAAQQTRDDLPDKTRMELFRRDYEEHSGMSARLAAQKDTLGGKETDEARQLEALKKLERQLETARGELTKSEREHAAVALAGNLRVGADCPVCLRPVEALPHHPEPGDLVAARTAVESARAEEVKQSTVYQTAAGETVAARQVAGGTAQRIAELAGKLSGAPTADSVSASLGEIGEADHALLGAREKAQEARTALKNAEAARSSLDTEVNQARANLHSARDSVVQLGAPGVDDSDLAAAWQTLAAWAGQQHAQHTARQQELDETAAGLQRELKEGQDAVSALLADHGIADLTDPLGAEMVIATHQERAANQLSAVQDNRRKAIELDELVGKHREDEQVAGELGRLLRATSFERWLCGEALDSLVAEASKTLLELSAGQYQLDRDERNDLVVIDFQDAGATRPVHTLSGGETFQASLALALALSRQVIGLSAGMRDLNSMFLDEGFGTLDEDTLETVATTLERLATGSEQMVGIITHVPALAERVPVRFVVGRAGSTATLRKERT